MVGQRVSVLVIDPNATVRRVLLSFLDSVAELSIVGDAGSGEEGVRLAHHLQPDLVLADNGLPDMSVSTLIPAIRGGSPQSRVIVLSTYDIDLYRETALASGAADFILKLDLVERLGAAVRTIF